MILNALRAWVVFVCNISGLTKFLLPIKKSKEKVKEENVQKAANNKQNEKPKEADSELPAQAAAEEEEKEEEEKEEDQNIMLDLDSDSASIDVEGLEPRETPSFVFLRVMLMLFLGWSTTMVVGHIVASVPMITGKLAVQCLGVKLKHDPYVYVIG